MKRIWISSVLCVGILLLAGCTSSKTPVQSATPQVATPQVITQSTTSVASKGDLTLAELKKYNGQNGTPAYVAIGGTIYNVTNAQGWRNGKHKDGATAGNDLTNMINSSPHGKDVLTNLPVIGKLK